MWQVIGHNWAVDLLQRSLASQRLAHAYLITGPDHIGKTHLALEFAAALNCNGEESPCHHCTPCRKTMQGTHPDVQVIKPESARLKIDQIRRLQYDLALSPHEGRRRVCVISQFERATTEAANALLKTLEEPPRHVVLILTASDASLLLPTIVSRCQILPLRSVPTPIIEATLRERTEDEAKVQLVAALAGGRVGWALQAIQEPALLEQRQDDAHQMLQVLRHGRARRIQQAEALAARDDIQDMLHTWQLCWRDVILLQHDCPELLANTDLSQELAQIAASSSPEQASAAWQSTRTVLDQIEKNVNARLAFEVMCLSWPRVKMGVTDSV
jgi:DNA polymerase III subunit delta'